MARTTTRSSRRATTARRCPPAIPRNTTAGRSTASDLIARGARRERGQRAEDAVADFLFARGFELIARNVRVGPLELDVVARRGPLAVIVEVRTRGRGSFTGGLASIDAKKRASLVRAAERYWRATLSKASGVERVRIDVAAVTFDEDGAQAAQVEYIEGALTA